MVSLSISPKELSDGKLTPEHLAAAVKAVSEDGFVVLENVVDLAHVDALRERMTEDVRLLQARKNAPGNWNSGNIQQTPPPFEPYLFRDVLVNDLVVEVSQAILGKGLKNAFYSGNTAVKSESRQPVHSDIGHLWKGLNEAHPAFALVVNVPVVDFYAVNGSTEIWPGSHLEPAISIFDGEIEISEEDLERRRAFAPPLQPELKVGSILIRDIRMWHAGMPNTTDVPRPMIAMIHTTHWYTLEGRVPFPKGTEHYFDNSPLTWMIDFVDAPIDHISTVSGYKYEEVEA